MWYQQQHVFLSYSDAGRAKNGFSLPKVFCGPNIYASQVIEKTQTDACIDFVAKYPDTKVGQRTFDKYFSSDSFSP
jgi:hypothetical protein